MVKKISSMGSLVDPFTKTLIGRVFDGHKDIISARGVPNGSLHQDIDR